MTIRQCAGVDGFRSVSELLGSFDQDSELAVGFNRLKQLVASLLSE